MAILLRKNQKIFGESGTTAEFGVIGSDAAGSIATTKDIEAMQALSQYSAGLFSITANLNEPPRGEDFNSLLYMVTAQLAYIFQTGIPEYDPLASYYQNISFCQVAGVRYQCIQGSSGAPCIGKAPATEITYWVPLLNVTRGGGVIASNTAVGSSALGSNTTGAGNTAVGYSALRSSTIASSLTAVGDQALAANTTGNYNTAVGYQALTANTTGNANTAVGFQALRSSTIASSLTAVGYQALAENTTGNANTAVGYQALRSSTIASSLTAVGYQALTANTTGNYNTAVGRLSLWSNTVGNTNTAVGYSALSGLLTGSNNTGLGAGSQSVSDTTNNSITLGNSDITSLRCAVTSITAISDKRDKKNIETLGLGLEFIRALNPCGWNYDLRSDYADGISTGEKMRKTKDYGFIAQDLQKVQNDFGIDLGLVLEDNPERLEASPGKLLTVLIKAVQELADKVSALEG